ncbi:MAG: sulfur carrier protein ThiS [Kiritimatiellaeota bacterium]|nr:sulfur carrier protein ThiS [Kiritimatiellota bacterium]
MQLLINGEKLERPEGEMLAGLLAALGADAARVAVLVNDEVMPSARRAAVALHAGDRVEILTFAGGG